MRHRNQSLDLLRILAAAAVVCVHVAGSDVLGRPDLQSADWWIGNFYGSFVRWCVPVFVMVSGATLLSQEPHRAPGKFLQRRLWRIIPVAAFWTLLYLGWQTHLRFDLGSLTGMVFQGQTHLWYLYMTVGLYLIAPLLSQFIVASSPRMILGAIILSLGSAAGYGLARQYSIDPRVGYCLFEWPLYVGYFLAGYYLSRNAARNRPAAAWRYAGLASLCGMGIAILVGAMLPWLGVMASSEIMYCYLNPFVIAMSIFVFLAAYREEPAEQTAGSRLMAILTRVAPYTLGIYAIHPLSLRLLHHVGLTADLFPPLWGVPVLTFAAFAASLGIAFIMGLVPGVRRLVT